MTRNLYTIGYEGVQIEDFVRTLLDAGVGTLLDVREVPISRKRGFSKSILRKTLESYGIEYVHLRGLGDPKPGRVAARAGDLHAFRRIFSKHMKTDVAKADLAVAAALAKESAACLMCFERDPCDCHRSIVARHLVHITDLSVRNLSVFAKTVRHAKRAAVNLGP